MNYEINYSNEIDIKNLYIRRIVERVITYLSLSLKSEDVNQYHVVFSNQVNKKTFFEPLIGLNFYHISNKSIRLFVKSITDKEIVFLLGSTVTSINLQDSNRLCHLLLYFKSSDEDILIEDFLLREFSKSKITEK
jgi:hypothetical protein